MSSELTWLPIWSNPNYRYTGTIQKKNRVITRNVVGYLYLDTCIGSDNGHYAHSTWHPTQCGNNNSHPHPIQCADKPYSHAEGVGIAAAIVMWIVSANGTSHILIYRSIDSVLLAWATQGTTGPVMVPIHISKGYYISINNFTIYYTEINISD